LPHDIFANPPKVSRNICKAPNQISILVDTKVGEIAIAFEDANANSCSF
jgi:hypothetical protein